MQQFEVPGRFPSLNDVLRIKNGVQRNRMKRELDNRVAWSAKQAGIRPVGRCMVRVGWLEKDARRDWDNVRTGMKFVLDGLQKAEVIPNDSQRYVLDLDDWYGHDKGNPRLIVQIYEEGEQTWPKSRCLRRK